MSFQRGESFPFWFAGIAATSGAASFLNATLVLRLGMRHLITLALGAQIVLSGAIALALSRGLLPRWLSFSAHLDRTTGVFMLASPTIGNLNALALEPLSHIADMAASVNRAIAAVVSAGIAAPIGLALHGTPETLMAATAGLAALGVGPMKAIPRKI